METKKELCKALFEVHKEINATPLLFDSEVKYGNTNFKYTGLPGLLLYIRPKLEKHGLFLVQDTIQHGDTCIEKVITYIVHAETGQSTSITAALLSPPDENLSVRERYKEWGCEHTYKRRYLLMGKLGISADKDKSEEPNKKQDDREPDQDDSHNKKQNSYNITEKQLEYLHKLLKNRPNKLVELLEDYKSLELIPKNEFNAILDRVKN